jgi:hypothetical protein
VAFGRVGTEIPGPETFGYAALAFREDLNGERPLGAVGLRHRGDADVRTRLDFRDRGLGDPEYRHIVGQAYLHLGTLARFHRKQGAVDGFDGAADARWVTVRTPVSTDITMSDARARARSMTKSSAWLPPGVFPR